MNLAEVEELAASIPKGAFIVAAWERPVKQLKAYKGFPLFKRTRMVVRTGIDYNKKKSVIEARANGDLPKDAQKPNGKSWHIFPFILVKDTDPTQFYFRMYGESMVSVKSEYIVKTLEWETSFTKAEAMEKFGHQMAANEKGERNAFGVFDLKIESLDRLHHTIAEKEAIAILA